LFTAKPTDTFKIRVTVYVREKFFHT